ncbi:MAG: maturase [Nitrospinae bacterium]|nr:maturase [Nitrospinota bacterium]
MKRRTSRQKYRASLANFRVWSKENRNLPLRLLFGKLNSKLHGYYNYYGLRFNSKSLWDFLYQVERILFKWINSRSQKKSYNWKGFKQLLEEFKVPRPRIAANF